MVWTELTSSGGLTDVAPSPRSAHAAAAYLDRFLLVFGGGSVVKLLSLEFGFKPSIVCKTLGTMGSPCSDDSWK